MAIVPLSKLTIYGMSDQRESVLDELQQLGCVHLVPFKETETARTELASKDAITAYRYLLRAPMKRRPATDSSKFNREELVRELLRIKDRRVELHDEQDELLDAIELANSRGATFSCRRRASCRGSSFTSIACRSASNRDCRPIISGKLWHSDNRVCLCGRDRQRRTDGHRI